MNRTMTLTADMIEYASRGFANQVHAYISRNGRRMGAVVEGADGQWRDQCGGDERPYDVADGFARAAHEAADDMARRVATVKTAPSRTASLGAQLWEPCERCGAEPSYARANGHLCAECIRSGEDHPRIPGGAVPEFPVEPDGAR